MNTAICPEDLLKIILPAGKIPDRAKVTKIKGEMEYVLRHNLTLYNASQTPVIIEGFFLVNDRGDISQVTESKQICWLVTADDFISDGKNSWEAEHSQ